MLRPMLKYALVAVFGLATAAVGFAQRQPAASGGNSAGAATERNRATKDTNVKDDDAHSATTAADRNGQARQAKATFEVYKDKAGEYRWRLRATNTNILAVAAQGYSDKRSCLNAIESVKRDVAGAPVEEKEATAQGKDDDAKDGTGAASTAGSPARKAQQK